jgi:hypothetical protein
MDREQLQKVLFENCGFTAPGFEVIMEAIEQYKDYWVESALGGQYQPSVAGNQNQSLKPLKWGDRPDTPCPTTNWTYMLYYDPKTKKWESEVRRFLSWEPIGKHYNTEQEAQESCEHHRNQWLRDQLQ